MSMSWLDRSKEKTARVIPFRPILLVSLLGVAALLPPILPAYYLYLLTTVYMTALLATSLNFVLGYGGLLQLHHAVFFGVGAYTVALVLTKTTWPFWLAAVLAPLVAALLAAVIGWFCVRLRGLYFGMLTLALGQLVWAIIYKWRSFTSGDDGIHGIPLPGLVSSPTSVYYINLGVLVVCLLILYAVIKSPFGLTLVAIRDNPVRSQSVGVNIKRHQLAAFVLSGFFAGAAGVLFVLIEQSVSPSLLYWSKSAEILIMDLLGGMAVFLGPSLGAAILVVLSMVVGTYMDYWLLVMGLILLLLVLFLPQGVLGYLQELFGRKTVQGGERDAAN